MKNIQIGAALKTMRKNRGWTIHDVVVQLNDLYNIAVAEKTVYGWESDQAYPRTETLLLLCELYQSDAFTGNLLHIPADNRTSGKGNESSGYTKNDTGSDTEGSAERYTKTDGA